MLKKRPESSFELRLIGASATVKVPAKQLLMMGRLTLCLFLLGLGLAIRVPGGEPAATAWQPLFNGTNLNGWHVVLRTNRSEDPNHLVQVHDGVIHMYKDAPPDSAQPSGYIVTDKEYSNYHFRVQYKWGAKRFQPRTKTRRDAGVLYHIVGRDGVWPRSIECQIQENDVGDIFTVYTRLTAFVDPATTNRVIEVVTNQARVVRTNLVVRPVYEAPDQGGIPYVQGVADGIRRVIRNPMNEHEGWNTVELIVHGDEAMYIVNGKTNNRVKNIQQKLKGEWVPLAKGRLALQLEYAEVFYRNPEIEELGP